MDWLSWLFQWLAGIIQFIIGIVLGTIITGAFTWKVIVPRVMENKTIQELINEIKATKKSIENFFKSEEYRDMVKLFREGKKLLKEVLENQKNQNVNNDNVNPWWITGFTEGEGAFYATVRTKGNKGLYVDVGFNLSQKTPELLKKVQKFFGFGSLSHKATDCWCYQATGLSNADKLVAFFKRYPLQGRKKQDFETWLKIIDIVKAKEHLTQQGALRILELRKQMNVLGKGHRVNEAKIIGRIQKRHSNRHYLKWTNDEDNYLKANRHLGYKKLAKHFKRTPNAVKARWLRLRNNQTSNLPR